MAEKILYYLGAGASAQVLPLAKSVRDDSKDKIYLAGEPEVPKIKGLIYELEHLNRETAIQDIINSKQGKILVSILSNCASLAVSAKDFGDIDTYAKYLHIVDNVGITFSQLKKTLSQYFSIKQTILNAVDKRYLPWLVSIMDRRRFPDNVKILSWNYDYQVQIAASQIFQTEESIEYKHGGSTYSPSGLLYLPNLNSHFSDHDFLSMIHLNGIAGYGVGNGDRRASVFQIRRYKDPGLILDYLYGEAVSNMLHFAWENNGYHKSLMDSVKKMIAGTTIMVVIGYSFPFFNREVDKEVFQSLLDGGTLKRIYYQDPKLDGQQLYSQFGIEKHIDIQHIKQTDNFHVPFEY